MSIDLLRLAMLYFEPIPKNWRSWKMTIGKTVVETMGAWETEGNLRLLVVAKIDLPQLPILNPDGTIKIPKNPRKEAETAIETIANIIAISEMCKRKISSPSPCIAFLPRDEKTKTWLDNTKGIRTKSQVIPNARFCIPIEEKLLDMLKDRWDGVALLAEALSNTNAMGQFHEYIRFFECAFAQSSYHLIKSLSDFLIGANQGYKKAEITNWVKKLRDPATHADRRSHFILESDIRPVVMRVRQAAYDVLFNKNIWHNKDIHRKEKIWTPPAGTSSESNGIFIIQHKQPTIEFQILDEFGAYPQDLSAHINNIPPSWWTKEIEEKT